jgi:leukotriene-A4 hydrolase
MNKLNYSLSIVFLLIIITLSNCNNINTNKENKSDNKIIFNELKSYPKDFHSFSNPNEALVTHLDLDIKVNFETKIVEGVAKYNIRKTVDATKIILDVKDLDIAKVTLDNELDTTSFRIASKNEEGNALEIDIKSETKSISIFYKTNSNTGAIQWLDPEQTGDKKFPFMFTQGQSVFTRTWIPCQDSPSIRVTYNATVSVPNNLLAVMSASNPQDKNSTGVYKFVMNQPIPSYLISLAVGDIEFKKIGNRTGIYAEPSLLDKAVNEFSDLEKMLEATEELYGAYQWERYDVLVLPPSFPYGGMENPRLTFATPTIIAGDKSLTSLIAHELAHSWSGNLVTNATWNDFWINEGFTVYLEKRIMEKIYGKDYAEMLNKLDFEYMLVEMKELGETSPETKLKLNTDSKNADDALSTEIAYNKGYFFLRMLEEKVGRDKFDLFLKNYFKDNAFNSITTEDLLVYLDNKLLKPEKLNLNINEWIYETGLPKNHPIIKSDRLAKVETEQKLWLGNKKQLKEIETKAWSTQEWLHFLELLSNNLTHEQLAELDTIFKFTISGNCEIKETWLELAIQNDYKSVYPAVEEFLLTVGRRKYIKPLYIALIETKSGEVFANAVYSKARKNYHSISAESIDEILDYQPVVSKTKVVF